MFPESRSRQKQRQLNRNTWFGRGLHWFSGGFSEPSLREYANPREHANPREYANLFWHRVFPTSFPLFQFNFAVLTHFVHRDGSKLSAVSNIYPLSVP